jgi:hypothetical protein
MRLPFVTKRVLITGIVAALAGGAAAVTVPVVAAHLTPSASAPAANASQDLAVGAKGFRHARLVHVLLKATVKETGLSRDAVLQRLRAGQTIDQIAGDKAQSVESDVLSALKTRLDKAVAAGKITKDREASLLADGKSRLEKLMSTSLPSTGHNRNRHAPSTSPGAV